MHGNASSTVTLSESGVEAAKKTLIANQEQQLEFLPDSQHDGKTQIFFPHPTYSPASVLSSLSKPAQSPQNNNNAFNKQKKKYIEEKKEKK